MTPAEVEQIRQKVRVKFEALRQEYLTKKSQGYDVAEVEKLIDRLRQAREDKQWREVVRLLNEIEDALAVAKKPVPPPPSKALDPTGVRPERVIENAARDVSSFRFGIAFGRPGGHASNYSSLAKLGATWMKTVIVPWGKVEPAPPLNGKHSYDWTIVDGVVREYQAAGFVNIIMPLMSRSAWGAEALRKADIYASSPPKKEHLSDYEDFIASVVERYDGDGVNDMPGLKEPVRCWQIENEAHHAGYWQGSLEEYGNILRLGYAAAKRADPKCTIFLSGLNFSDLFDGVPAQGGAEDVGRRVRSLSADHRNSLKFMVEILKMNKYFDAVEFHYLRDYRGIYGTVQWIREEMRKNGYTKPIWAGEVVAAPMFFDTAFFSSLSKGELEGRFAALDDDRSSRHREVKEWYQAEQANNLIKKFIAAMEVGLDGLIMSQLSDWKGEYPLKNFWYQGMADRNGDPRPAFYAYRMLVGKLAGVKTIQRLQSSQDVYTYKLTKKTGAFYVAWAEGGRKTIDLPVDADRVIVTQAPIRRGGSGDAQEKYSANSGMVQLNLTSTPLLVEPLTK